MTKIIITDNKVIFDGHSNTKEECENTTLLCNALKNSTDYKTIKYEDGYAEFEKIGIVKELKFLRSPLSIDLYDSISGDRVLGISSDSEITLSFSGNIATFTITGGSMSFDYTNDTYITSYDTSTGTSLTATFKNNIENITLKDADAPKKYNISFITTSKISIDLTTLTGWDTVTPGEHTIQVVAKATGYRDSAKSAAVSFTKASAKVLLYAGTYQFIENPNMNISIDETISGKMNTLTGNNTYGEQTSFDGISVVDSAGQIGMVFIGNSTSGNNVQCAGGDWKYANTDGDEYTTTDTSKLRTIVLETDQNVSQEFYNWAITQGNLVKVEETTGETWVLNETINLSTQTFTTNFVSNGQNFNSLKLTNTSLEYDTTTVYAKFVPDGSNWVKGEAYRTIILSESATGDLLTWLQANGTKQGGGTTTAHKLTWSDSTMVVTVNGNAATSPYTLANGDTIVLKRTSGWQSINIITDTGTFDTDSTQSPLAVSNSDIKLQNGNVDMSPSMKFGFTINYEENAHSGGNIQ